MNRAFAEPITQCLEADHRLLDTMLLESERAARAGDFIEAHERFAAFASGLLDHIEAEEGILFPEIEGLSPGARGPISVMRAEHGEFRVLLDRIGADLAAEKPDWQTSVVRIKDALFAHNMKEERVLYPMADAAARDAGRATALVERLQGVLAVHRDEF